MYFLVNIHINNQSTLYKVNSVATSLNQWSGEQAVKTKKNRLDFESEGSWTSGKFDGTGNQPVRDQNY
jgi:hypothetical protein